MCDCSIMDASDFILTCDDCIFAKLMAVPCQDCKGWVGIAFLEVQGQFRMELWVGYNYGCNHSQGDIEFS